VVGRHDNGVKGNAKESNRHCETANSNLPGAKGSMENAFTRLGLSAREQEQTLKVARTIADREAAPDSQAKHLGEALRQRTLERDTPTNGVRLH